MTGADKAFTGSIPAIYQRHMVPMIFEPYAQDIAERAARLRPEKVIEIAAGTGVVTRALADRLGSDADIVATDLNQPMLDLAASLQDGQGRVSFRQANASALPFEDDGFDLAICQFGVMFFPDKLQSYRETRRVLKPGGTYLFSVWDRIAVNAFVAVANDVLARRYPNDPPRFMERAPHGYHDTQEITSALNQAGFSAIAVETVAKRARSESATSAATGYCQGNPVREEIEAREPGGLQAVTEAVAEALATHFGHGPIEGEIRAHIVTARK